jgi:hypothetical protein
MTNLCKGTVKKCCYLSTYDCRSCLNTSACCLKVEGERTGPEIMKGFFNSLDKVERETLCEYLGEKHDKG